MKMKTVYEANPALGDPMSIQVNILQVIEVEDSSRVLYQGQLTENGHRLDKLRSDLRRYQVRLEIFLCRMAKDRIILTQGWLEEAEGRAPGSPASTLSSRGNGNGSSPRRSSVSDEVESLSR